MKQLLLTAIILLIATSFSFSQTLEYETKELHDLYGQIKLVNPGGETSALYGDVEGSPYLSNEFKNGTVYTTTKQKFVNIPLRFNIYNDNFEFKTSDDQIMEMATPETVEKVEYNNCYMVYIAYKGEKEGNGFFKILEEGNATLYAHHEIAFKDSPRQEAFTLPEPPKFINKQNSHYIRFGTEKAIKIGKKNELIQLFPDHQSQVSAFIKKNKIKTNKPEQLKKLVQFYNSLN